MNKMEGSVKVRFAVLSLALASLACEEATPPPSGTLGKRNYTWSYDTLSYPGSYQTNMQSAFGTSASNVYVVGHNDTRYGKMYKYNGQYWAPVDLTHIRTGALEDIHGTGPSDIWAVGSELFLDPTTGRILDSTLVIRFNGTTWQRVITPRRRSLFAVWAASPTSVWASSADGYVLRFDGSNWMVYDLGRQYFCSSIAALSPNEAYMMGHVSDWAPPVDSSGSFLFRFDGSNWRRIDSVMNTPGAPPASLGAGLYAWNGLLYSLGPNVYRRSGNAWAKLANAQVGHMWQSGPNNIVAVAPAVWHYNGIDWQEFTHLYALSFWFDCYTDGEEVFIVGNDNSKSIILHGK